MPKAMKKATELWLKLLIFTDVTREGKWVTQGYCQSVALWKLLEPRSSSQFSIFQGHLLPTESVRAGCKGKAALCPLCPLLAHNRTDLQKDNLPGFLQNTCGTQKKVLIPNSFVYASFYPRKQLWITLSKYQNKYCSISQCPSTLLKIMFLPSGSFH